MLYKPDWPAARQRLTALWHGELDERPCLQVTAPLPRPDLPPACEPVDDEARWLDPLYLTNTAIRAVAGTWWGGEAIPSLLVQGGWMWRAGQAGQEAGALDA